VGSAGSAAPSSAGCDLGGLPRDASSKLSRLCGEKRLPMSHIKSCPNAHAICLA
jgi:hypothetical protein